MKKLSRRQFIYCSAAFLTSTLSGQTQWPLAANVSEAAIADDIRGRVFKGDAPKKIWKWSHEGYLYKYLEGFVNKTELMGYIDQALDKNDSYDFAGWRRGEIVSKSQLELPSEIDTAPLFA